MRIFWKRLMESTLAIFWSNCAHFTIGRDHQIQTMVRTITCQVPLVSDKAMSARVATTVDKIYQ